LFGLLCIADTVQSTHVSHPCTLWKGCMW
jgi:hypothetical protein